MFQISEHYSRVKALNVKIDGKQSPSVPTMPDAKTRELRARLILEECMETIDALGCGIYLDKYQEIFFDQISIKAEYPPNLVEIADGCADISVVTIGTLVACGIKDMELFKEVDENNLAKFGPGGHLREDGKWVKPPNHPKPDIARILREQGWDA